jgi:hypothetical protein
MNSLVKYFRDFLLSKGTITAVVSTRIYEQPLPAECAFPAIGFEVLSGGDLGPSAGSQSNAPPLQDRYVLVRCWAVDQDAARSLWGIVHDAIAGTVATKQGGVCMGQIYVSDPESLGVDTTDGMFVCQGTYHILMEV